MPARSRVLLRVLLMTAVMVVQMSPPGRTQGARGLISLSVGEGRLLRLNHDSTGVFMGDSSIADVQVVSPRTLYVYGRKPGETSLSATEANSNVAADIKLLVTRSGDAAQAALPHRGDVSLAFVGNQIVVRGKVRNLGEALEANAAAHAYNGKGLPPLDRTQLAGAQQVTLRVRIAEVSRTTINQLGLNLNVVADPGSFAINVLTGSFLGQSVVSSLGTSLSGQSTVTSFGQASAGVKTNRVNANALIDALQSEGLVTTLAEPNLTTISGETASFEAGGQVPIPVPQSFGVTTIQYNDFGVQLSFTPIILPGDRIAMRVRPEVSEISSANAVSISGTTVPSFVSRSAETNVEIASGQTLAIAGLYQRSEQNTLSKFPFLGDVPILGALFRSDSYQRDETELVILVTPYLTQPVSDPAAIPLPTDAAGLRPGRSRPGSSGPGSSVPGTPAAQAGVGFVVY